MAILDALCPPDQIESGMCIAPWYDSAFDAAVCFCAALAAFLIVTLASITAPSHKRVVASVVYVIGAATAIAMFLDMPSIGHLNAAICALIAGLLGAGLVVWFTRKRAVVA